MPNTENSLKFFDNEKVENEFMKYLERKFDEKYGTPKSLSNLINEFENFNNYQNINNLLNKKNSLLFQNILTTSEKNEIKWDYEYFQSNGNIFQCRVDKEKQVNVYHLTCLNYFLQIIGLGIYHTSIEIDSYEYTFGSSKEDVAGFYINKVGEISKLLKLKEKIYMGNTIYTETNIERILALESPYWMGRTYDPFLKNCNR